VSTSLSFFAPCAKGLEYLLVDELRQLGAANVREALAGVHFEGDLGVGYRACLWSRLASRILLKLAEFDANDDAELYAGVGRIDWSAHLSERGTLAVDANVHSSRLTHANYAAQKAKDAVVDQFRDKTGERPSVDPIAPDVRINLSIRKNRATLSIDLAGEALHRRGWRVQQGDAPLKETLACAVLLRGGWPETEAQGGALIDPMCGSGTLLIEAARMAADIAPALERERFGFSDWRGHDADLWGSLRAEARERAKRGLAKLAEAKVPRFYGFDLDAKAVRAARINVQQAGLPDAIVIAQRDIAELVPPSGLQPGLVVCNPPYDERLAADTALYRRFGTVLKRGFAGWRAVVLTAADADLGRALGLRPDKRYALYNGALACELLRIDSILPPLDKSAARPVEKTPLSEGAQMVANRLRRNLRVLKAWLKKEGVTCFRAYDADLPEYAAAIDVYEGVPEDEPDAAPRVFLHVQEYQAPATIPEDVAKSRLRELVAAAADVFETPRDAIAIKTRQRGKGGSKYGRFDRRGQYLHVREGEASLRVNLFDYLDTGLFLDHRPLRLRIASEARGKRFLNLFCYTGAASVHAALGGAASTTSVDLSATYLDWAARNFALNGLGGPSHRFVQADVMEWLEEERARFDLIFCDPPTFSNSARAEDFDVQREHVRLLRACFAHLAPGGLILFSNNARRFRLDPELIEEFDVRDIRERTIGPDFSRDPRIHGAWELRRR